MQDTNSHMPGLASQLGEQILEVDHVALAVENLDESVRWYSTVLGFSLEERYAAAGARTSMLYARMQAGRTVLVLLQGTSPESQISRFLAQFGCGVHHIAFAVNDLDAAIIKANEAGIFPETPVASDEGIRQVFFCRDPATGVRVELIERRDGSPAKSNIEKLFRALEEQDMY